MTNLMRHTASVFRPVVQQGQTTQDITGYTQVYAGVPCFFQPATARMEEFYSQRGTTMDTVIYTTATQNTYLREDIFVDGSGRQFHLVAAPKPALDGTLYYELVAEQYPEGAKKRLDTGAYGQ